MIRDLISLILFVGGTFAAAPGCLAAPQDTHPHAQHHEDMLKRGDKAMGFEQSKTLHHFRLTPAGGRIEVEVLSPGDHTSLRQIRLHLSEIARRFADGDFRLPRIIHDEDPPGSAAMKELRSAIEYRFEETERGGRVLIRTGDSRALAALHQFLRYQIREHRTGDTLEVSRD